MTLGPRRRGGGTDRVALTERSHPRPYADVRSGRKQGRILNAVAGTMLLGSLLIISVVGFSRVFFLTTLDQGPPSTEDESQTTIRRESPQKPNDPPILTIFSESPRTMSPHKVPLPNRTTTASRLKVYEYPQFHSRNTQCGNVPIEPLPIDDFPDDDPYLPWIHDYVIQEDRVRIVAQNKRRCETGQGKEGIMSYREPQIALFQPIPVSYDQSKNIYRLDPDVKSATAPETRFLCRFHTNESSFTTFSEYDFNYEFVLWRKDKLPMFKTTGKDVSVFELSQLLFSCPIPPKFQSALSNAVSRPLVFLDIVPIRTPARTRPLLSFHQTGSRSKLSLVSKTFDAANAFGTRHVLPQIRDSGRWANLPLCPVRTTQRQHTLVACTWTAARYKRRGDSTEIRDAAARLREWIVFHKLVGFEHFYIYDNTAENETYVSPLRAIANAFGEELVTYHYWPAKICNNNRPNHQNPGERSSQYAAEASCRVRYGASTTWMAFLDTDEYMVPSNHSSWHDVLETKHDYDVLKMRSSRGKPRLKYMDPINQCEMPNRRRAKIATDTCLVPKQNETFLRVYNCDYIRPPRPDRFDRAMKQIFRPSQVLSHFVHYSTVTRRIATYYGENPNGFRKSVTSEDYRDTFLNELTEGSLIHAKTVLPFEMTTRSSSCATGAKHTCPVGYECPASTPFIDAIHQKNLFKDESGQFCNCWPDPYVESVWLPRLEKALDGMR